MGKGIFKDFWIKLISVAIAIALWFYVNSEKPRNITLSISPTLRVRVIPEQETLFPERKKISEIIPDKVKIILCGKLGKILSLNAKKIELNLPLVVSKRDTEVLYKFSDMDVIIPSEVEVELVKIDPNQVLVRIK